MQNRQLHFVEPEKKTECLNGPPRAMKQEGGNYVSATLQAGVLRHMTQGFAVRLIFERARSSLFKQSSVYRSDNRTWAVDAIMARQALGVAWLPTSGESTDGVAVALPISGIPDTLPS